jgi:hypothetical protein
LARRPDGIFVAPFEQGAKSAPSYSAPLGLVSKRRDRNGRGASSASSFRCHSDRARLTADQIALLIWIDAQQFALGRIERSRGCDQSFTAGGEQILELETTAAKIASDHSNSEPCAR